MTVVQPAHEDLAIRRVLDLGEILEDLPELQLVAEDPHPLIVGLVDVPLEVLAGVPSSW